LGFFFFFFFFFFVKFLFFLYFFFFFFFFFFYSETAAADAFRQHAALDCRDQLGKMTVAIVDPEELSAMPITGGQELARITIERAKERLR